MTTLPLSGNATLVALPRGFALRAPGLRGSATLMEVQDLAMRGPELRFAELETAFAGAGLSEVAQIELKVTSVPVPAATEPLRGPDGADAFELHVPDLGPEVAQVVLSIDEAGIQRWHFAEPLGAEAASEVRGPGATRVFRIPSAVPPPQDSAVRGLAGWIGRKLLKVLIYPVADVMLGPLLDHLLGKWEGLHRPYAVRRFLPGDRAPLAVEDWQRLAAGRALLLVHGTFSTAEAAFSDLGDETLQTLATAYQNRVFAFDHPTLSEAPEANVRWFFGQIPAGVDLEVDIICHSRGGLVSRLMAGFPEEFGMAGRFRVRRLVLAGVPNEGTILTNSDHMVHFLDRLTTLVGLLPCPLATSILDGVLAVVKVVGHAGLSTLPGLEAMCPENPLLARLAASSLPGCVLYGLGSNFEPTDPGLQGLVGKVGDALVDRAFEGVANDLVVPTPGMNAWGGAIRIPPDNYRFYPPSAGVIHTQYFRQPDTWQALQSWLG